MKLSVGCRNRQVGKGWIGVDIVDPPWAEKFPDRFLKVDSVFLPFTEGNFEEVLAQHVFEHFPRTQEKRLDAMREWWRVLAPGGLLRVIVPNTARYCHQYVEGKWDAETLSNMLYGTQEHAGEIHYAGYDDKSLVKIFQKTLGKSCIVESLTFGQRGLWKIKDIEIRANFRKTNEQTLSR